MMNKRGVSALTLIFLTCLFLVSTIVVILLTTWSGESIIPNANESYGETKAGEGPISGGNPAICSDGLDNDVDGFIDFDARRGGAGPHEDDERTD